MVGGFYNFLRTRIGRAFLCGMVSIVILFMTPAPSIALPPIEGGQVITGYLDVYASNGGNRTHRGIDIAGASGQAIFAPISGTVSFAGSIPATETDSGATMLGVSLRMQDGRVVTLMPFDEVYVLEGQAISEGQPLGTLAARGDASSSQTHVHLGLKTRRTYEDPSWLLGVAAGTSEHESENQQVGAGAFAGSASAALDSATSDVAGLSAADAAGLSAADAAVGDAEGVVANSDAAASEKARFQGDSLDDLQTYSASNAAQGIGAIESRGASGALGSLGHATAGMQGLVQDASGALGADVAITGAVTSGDATLVFASQNEIEKPALITAFQGWIGTHATALHTHMAAFMGDMSAGALAGGLTLVAAIVALGAALAIARQKRRSICISLHREFGRTKVKE